MCPGRHQAGLASRGGRRRGCQSPDPGNLQGPPHGHDHWRMPASCIFQTPAACIGYTASSGVTSGAGRPRSCLTSYPYDSWATWLRESDLREGREPRWRKRGSDSTPFSLEAWRSKAETAGPQAYTRQPSGRDGPGRAGVTRPARTSGPKAAGSGSRMSAWISRSGGEARLERLELVTIDDVLP